VMLDVQMHGDDEDAAPAYGADDFDVFYRAEFGRLAGALRLVVNDPHLAEETAQEAFVRAYAAWARVRHLDRPAGGLYTTAFNLVRRHWRLRRRPPADLPQPVGQGPETSAARLALTQALLSLPLNQRKAVVARHVLGFSGEEAAALVGVSPGALRALLHRAVTTLRLDPAFARED
jgi:RNA polymerase sigma-70 factor (ECF subfamily)